MFGGFFKRADLLMYHFLIKHNCPGNGGFQSIVSPTPSLILSLTDTHIVKYVCVSSMLNQEQRPLAASHSY